VALVGVACGVLIPGTAGGTAATVLVGIGLVGVVSLIFYEVGLTEDRDRAARRETEERAARRETEERAARRETEERAEQRETGERSAEGLPRDPGSPAEHQGGRPRPLDRRRGQRRRLR
jgi:hypothetical protein